MGLLGIQNHPAVYIKFRVIIRDNVENVLSGSPCRERAFAPYAEAVLTDTGGGGAFPLEINVFNRADECRIASHIRIVVKLHVESVLKHDAVVGEFRLGDDGAGREGLVHPGHEVAGESGACITLVADPPGIRDKSFNLLILRYYVEKVLVFASRIVNHDARLIRFREGEPEHPGGRNAGKLSFNARVLQVHAVVIRCCRLSVVGV